MRKITKRILSSVMAAVLVIGAVPYSVPISVETVQAATDLTLYADDYVVDLQIIKNSELLKALNKIIIGKDEGLTFGELKSYDGAIDLSAYPNINDVTGLGYAVNASSINLSALTKVTKIYANEFRTCAFTEFKLPTNLVEIETKAFLGCSNLKTIDFPNTLKKIGGQAFESCSVLDGIEFPDGLEKLGDESFANCKKLKKIVIPDNINAALEGSDSEALLGIGAGVFNGCTSLTSIVFGAGMTVIPAGFLQKTEALRSVTIPEKITDIRSSAFSGSGIISIDLSKNTKMTVINTMTFSNCHSLSKVVLPSGITKIEANAFNGCNLLPNTDFISGLTKLVQIGSYAFASSGIASAHIPGNVEKIGSSAFSNCDKLKSVVIDDFTYTPSTEVIKEIGDYAFAQCSYLEKVTLPEKNQNNKLVDIEIGNYAFWLCAHLNTINYPLNISKIGNYAFYQASRVVSDWDMPDDYPDKRRGERGYTELSNVYTKPTEGTEPFVICTNDTDFPEYYQNKTVYIDPDKVYDKDLYEEYKKDSVAFKEDNSSAIYDIYSQMTGNEEFIYFDPLGIRYVDVRQIYSMLTVQSDEDDNFKVKAVAYVSQYFIHDTKEAGDVAFTVYDSDGTVRIVYINPSKVYKHFGSGLFRHVPKEKMMRCEALFGDEYQHVVYLNEYDIYREQQTDYDYACQISGINKMYEQRISGQTEIDLSKNINMQVGEGAFAEIYSLQKITLPEDMTTIPKNLLYGCSYALEGGIGGALISSYGMAADKWYSGLKTAVMSNVVTDIGVSAFQNCYALVMDDSVKLSNNLVSIGSSAFRNCESLNKITLPATLEYIGDSAFQGTSRSIDGLMVSATGLRDLNVSGASSLEYIGKNAFTQSAFTNFDMNASAPVSKILTGTFSKCEFLERIIFSPNIKYVGKTALSYCYRLESVHAADTCVLDYEMCKGSLMVKTIPTGVNAYAVENANGNTYTYIHTKRFVLSVDVQNTKVAVRENGTAMLPLSNVDSDGVSFYKLIKIGENSSYTYNSTTGELEEDKACQYVVPEFDYSARMTIPENNYMGSSKEAMVGIKLNGISEVTNMNLVVEEELRFIISTDHNTAISCTPQAQYSLDVTKNPCESIECDERVYVEYTGSYTIAPTFVPQYADSNITDKVKWNVESGNDLITVTPSADGLSAIVTPTKTQYGTASVRVTAGEVTKIIQVSISVPASKITLSKTSMEMSVGAEAEELRATLSYSAANKEYATLYGDNVKYTSSDESIIQLETATDENGVAYCKIIAVGYGKATITAASMTKPSVKATCNISIVAADVGMTVTDLDGNVINETSNLELVNENKVTYNYNIESDLKLNNLSYTANDDIVEFAYNNTKKTFTLSGIKRGSTEVIVYPSAADPEKSGVKLYVTVNADVDDITLTKQDIVVGDKENVFVSLKNVFGEVTNSATADGFNSVTDNKIVFTSSDETIAKVDEFGNVEALNYSSGNNVVTITCNAYREDEVVATKTTNVYIQKESVEQTTTSSENTAKPVVPTGFTCISEGKGSITVNANNPGNGQKYVVYVDGYEWATVDSLPAVLTGLDYGVHYVSISGSVGNKESDVCEQLEVYILSEDPVKETTPQATTAQNTTTQNTTTASNGQTTTKATETTKQSTTTATPTSQATTTKQSTTTATPTGQVTTTKQNATEGTGANVSVNEKVVKASKAKIKKAVRAKNNKKVKITLNKVNGASGYEVTYSTNKKFKKKYTKKVQINKVMKTISKLKANKKYYIKARAYIVVNGKKVYGKWSKIKTLKVKK